MLMIRLRKSFKEGGDTSVFNEGLNLDKTEYAIFFMITNAFQKVLKYFIFDKGQQAWRL